ncbi:MAG: S26 family signal peptidase [Methanomassiliicoccales archaeon]
MKFEARMSAKSRLKKLLRPFSGLILAAVIVLIFIGGLWLYAGIWPPLVVVESPSMQHSDQRSYIGIIDTGDMVILKTVRSATDIKPYLESYPSGYSTYGSLGDVVIYRPLGSEVRTPIIHRAICRVEYNQSGGGFDVPALRDLPRDLWQVSGGPSTWYNIKTTLILNEIGHDGVQVRIDFATMLNNFAAMHISPHGGLITLGDNNHGIIDQNSIGGICWRPVKDEWISGVARGEIPWFGLIKLYVNGQASRVPIPPNSQSNLLISLGLIIGVPIAIDASTIILEHKGIDLRSKMRKALHLPEKKKEEKGTKESASGTDDAGLGKGKAAQRKKNSMEKSGKGGSSSSRKGKGKDKG